MKNLQTLSCNCCGGAGRGRQWWNRDDGYGICGSCGLEQMQRYGLEQVELDNGKIGVNWFLPKNCAIRYVYRKEVNFLNEPVWCVIDVLDGLAISVERSEADAQLVCDRGNGKAVSA